MIWNDCNGCLSEVWLKIPWHSPLSAEMNNASAWRIGVPVTDLLPNWKWQFCDHSSCCAIQNKTCSNHMQRSKRHSCYVVWTNVSCQWLVALLSNLLHCLWMTGLAATSPMTVKSVTSANESRMNESRVSALHFVPNLGCCMENRWSCKWLLKLLSLLQEFSFFCHWFS